MHHHKMVCRIPLLDSYIQGQVHKLMSNLSFFLANTSLFLSGSWNFMDTYIITENTGVLLFKILMDFGYHWTSAWSRNALESRPYCVFKESRPQLLTFNLWNYVFFQYRCLSFIIKIHKYFNISHILQLTSAELKFTNTCE